MKRELFKTTCFGHVGMLDVHCSLPRYRWLVNMWLAYGGRDDIAAISLQKQTMKVLGNNPIVKRNILMESLSFQAQVSGVQEEDFTVDFPSILPGHPAFLYQLAGLGNSHSPLNHVIQNICI